MTTATTSGIACSTSTSSASRARCGPRSHTLRASPAAAVVVTCSIASWAGLPRRAVYSASKGALYALTLAMAADHVADGIRVNGVAPGTADTPWVARLLDAAARPGQPNGPRSRPGNRWAGS